MCTGEEAVGAADGIYIRPLMAKHAGDCYQERNFLAKSRKTCAILLIFNLFALETHAPRSSTFCCRSGDHQSGFLSTGRPSGSHRSLLFRALTYPSLHSSLSVCPDGIPILYCDFWSIHRWFPLYWRRKRLLFDEWAEFKRLLRWHLPNKYRHWLLIISLTNINTFPSCTTSIIKTSSSY